MIGVPPRQVTEWLAGAGLAGADLSVQGDALVVKLDGAGRGRLLSDPDLCARLVAQGRALGFRRVALELL